MWAVGSLVGEKMQIRCLQETHIELIKPPLQVIHIRNGCEGYSPSIKIPAQSELTSQNDIIERTSYFLGFNMQYSGITSVRPWDLFEISVWTEQQLKDMVESLPALLPLNYENLNKKLGQLNKYPLEIPVAIIAIALVISTLIMVVALVIIGLVIFKQRLKDLLPLAKMLVGKASPSEINQIKMIFRTLLELPPGHHKPPELPERRRSTSEPSADKRKSVSEPLPSIPEESSVRLGTSGVKSILPSSSDIRRYEQYLTKKKEELSKKKDELMKQLASKN